MNRLPLVWNDARDALLRELVATGTPRGGCVGPLNALPGAPITKLQQVAHRMHALRLSLTGPQRSAIWAENIRRQRTLSWTPERLAYLRQAYPIGTPQGEMLTALAAMSGPPIASWDALTAHANKVGLKRPIRVRKTVEAAKQRRAAKTEYEAKRRAAKAAVPRIVRPRGPAKAQRVAPPAPVAPPLEVVEYIEPTPERADAVTEARYARVKAALRKRGADAAALARVHGMPLREVFRLKMTIRMEQRA